LISAVSITSRLEFVSQVAVDALELNPKPQTQNPKPGGSRSIGGSCCALARGRSASAVAAATCSVWKEFACTTPLKSLCATSGVYYPLSLSLRVTPAAACTTRRRGEKSRARKRERERERESNREECIDNQQATESR
jgi:hypothetical protein